AEYRHDAGPASYPREVLRGERPKWLFVHFGQSKWTPAERVSPRQGNKNTPEKSLRHTKKSQHRPKWSVLALVCVLAIFQGYIVPHGAHRLVGGTDDAAGGVVDLLHPVGTPAHNAGDGKQGG